MQLIDFYHIVHERIQETIRLAKKRKEYDVIRGLKEARTILSREMLQAEGIAYEVTEKEET